MKTETKGITKKNGYAWLLEQCLKYEGKKVQVNRAQWKEVIAVLADLIEDTTTYNQTQDIISVPVIDTLWQLAVKRGKKRKQKKC